MSTWQGLKAMSNPSLTTPDFIERAKEKHGDKFDYSKAIYVSAIIKIEIICFKHGSFWQRPSNHTQGYGCPRCRLEKISQANGSNLVEFTQKAKGIHGDKYDYSRVNYQNATIKVEIVCPVHGSFWQAPFNHLGGRGCSICSLERVARDFTWTTDDFITRARSIHGNKYDYSKVDYQKATIKIEIVCPVHGSFWQLPHSHTSGNGCPVCRSSKGEKQIRKSLTSWGISFTRQKRFKACVDKDYLPFDFYFQIGKVLFLVEYDGRAHFVSIDNWGGEEKLAETQRRDAIKNQFAKDQGFILIRIPYTEFDNIESVLRNEIEKHTGQPLESIRSSQRTKTKVNLDPSEYHQGRLV